MSCKSCHSKNQRQFPAEINVHFPGFAGLMKPTVWVFPKLLICLGCGFAEFTLTSNTLKQLRESDSPADQLGTEVPLIWR